MRKLLTYLSILAAAVLFTPNTAEARTYSHGSSTYVSGHTSCGCPIYTKKVFVNHDRYGRPVYKYYNVPSSCNCKRSTSRTSNRYSSSCNNNARYSNSRYSTHSRYRSHGHQNNGSRVSVTYRR